GLDLRIYSNKVGRKVLSDIFDADQIKRPRGYSEDLKT
ncbi:MAG: hypothetical protein EZS28_051191, partial [Streblomastix strix]